MIGFLILVVSMMLVFGLIAFIVYYSFKKENDKIKKDKEADEKWLDNEKKNGRRVFIRVNTIVNNGNEPQRFDSKIFEPSVSRIAYKYSWRYTSEEAANDEIIKSYRRGYFIIEDLTYPISNCSSVRLIYKETK